MRIVTSFILAQNGFRRAWAQMGLFRKRESFIFKEIAGAFFLRR